MCILALYVPKPIEFYQSVGFLLVVYGLVCLLARGLTIRWPTCAVIIATIALATLAPGLAGVVSMAQGDYYDLAREWSGTGYSNGFFAITSYLFVGRGILVAISGMFAGLLACLIADRCTRRHRQGDKLQSINGVGQPSALEDSHQD